MPHFIVSHLCVHLYIPRANCILLNPSSVPEQAPFFPNIACIFKYRLNFQSALDAGGKIRYNNRITDWPSGRKEESTLYGWRQLWR